MYSVNVNTQSFINLFDMKTIHSSIILPVSSQVVCQGSAGAYPSIHRVNLKQ